MANVMQVYQGERIRTLGTPIIVVTGYSDVTGELRSEFFAFIRDIPDSFVYRRIAFKYETLPPHAVADDTNGMMNYAFIFAQEALHNFAADRLNNRHMPIDFATIHFEPIKEFALTMMFLMRDQVPHIDAIRRNADSPMLRALFQYWDRLPRLIEP